MKHTVKSGHANICQILSLLKMVNNKRKYQPLLSEDPHTFVRLVATVETETVFYVTNSFRLKQETMN
jgi:hypothetical protein